MKIVADWLKQVLFCMCFLELIYQLAPGKEWQKYIRFTGGLIFLVVLLHPVLQISSLMERVQERTWRWQIQEESRQLQEAQKELAQLQNEQIRKTYCRELERQIKEQVEYENGEVIQVEVTLQSQSQSQIRQVEILLKEEMQQTGQLRAQLAADYGLRESQIHIRCAQKHVT